MNNDIYSETKKLAILLNNAPLSNKEIATELTDSIDYSATSGEALMKLKYYLGELLSNKEKYNNEQVNLASDIYNEIVKLI